VGRPVVGRPSWPRVLSITGFSSRNAMTLRRPAQGQVSPKLSSISSRSATPIRAGELGRGARKLIWALRQSGAKSIPSERTVNRILERCGLIVPRRVHPKPRPASGKPDVSGEKPNALWTADYKGWWRTGDLKRCEPLTVRDQHSRFVLAVHVCRSPMLDEALQLFERLFELHGLPDRILTDNGTPFVAPSSRFGLTRLSAWWLSLGIDHLRSRKGTPADNGAHERMHRDMAFELEAFSAPTCEDQQRACDLWKADFNNCRPHEALGMKTPSQVYNPSATSYAAEKIGSCILRACSCVPSLAEASSKYRSTMIQLTEALAGYPVAIDPHSGPPHDLWFRPSSNWLPLTHRTTPLRRRYCSLFRCPQ
jgi:putative transposase